MPAAPRALPSAPRVGMRGNLMYQFILKGCFSRKKFFSPAFLQGFRRFSPPVWAFTSSFPQVCFL
jgi:hypothetical protein